MGASITSSCGCAATQFVTQVPPAAADAGSSNVGVDPGGTSPPAPMPMPGDPQVAPTTTTTSTASPASSLPSWPQWQQQLVQLGLSAEEVARIGAAGLTEVQLAQVYEEIRASLGGGAAPTGTAGGWDAEWAQRFTALGLPGDYIAQLEAEARRIGASDQQLQAAYDALAKQSGAQQPGWNAQVEQAFRELGMPDEVIQMYAQSNAPLSGLEAAYRHAATRVEDFRDRGWMDRFVAAKVPELEMWSLILGDEPAKDEDLEKVLDAAKGASMSPLAKAGQLTSSLLPGGRLMQYVLGREVVSGQRIDRTSPMEIGLAALSGLSVFTAFRGLRNLRAGWAARAGGYLELKGVNQTLGRLGLPAAGDAAADAAIGATQTWGARQKLLSLIPGTKLHREIVGLGHAEAAARAFNNGGAAKLLAGGADGQLQVSTLGQLFSDIRSGATQVRGGAIAYLGPIRSVPPMSLDAARGSEVITVARNLRIGNGNAQLAALLDVGGTKLAQSPTWLQHLGAFSDDLAGLSTLERSALGPAMSGSAVRSIGIENFTRDGWRQMRHFNRLASAGEPAWYTRLLGGAGAAATPAPAAGAVDDVAGAGAGAVDDLLPPGQASAVPLSVDAEGMVRTPSGLIVPTYASPVAGMAPTVVDDAAVGRLADAINRMRAGS